MTPDKLLLLHVPSRRELPTGGPLPAPPHRRVVLVLMGTEAAALVGLLVYIVTRIW